MKRNTLILVVLAVLGACSLLAPNPFVGTWETEFLGTLGYVFNADMTIEMYNDDGPTGSGVYSYTDDILTIDEDGSDPYAMAYQFNDDGTLTLSSGFTLIFTRVD